MGRLDGRIAMVTGAASGFGAGIARALAHQGAAVLVTDLDGGGANAIADELRARGLSAEAEAVDITDRASLEQAVVRAEDDFGGLDTLIANAGIGQRPSGILETEPDTLRRQFEVNALGAFLTVQAALPALRRRDPASILLTVSGIALVPRPQLYGYGMAKAAAMYLMKAMASELAPERIRVNGLFPAVGDTPMLAEFVGGALTDAAAGAFASALPLGRLITPEDVGQAAVFLSSPSEAGALTGCALPVDAGRCL
ncbi:MAG: glucose 1-dehydrogenase [Paracoccaceae bacterium]|nr:glucose 1-dehydrogenase [Paracoccaceae bacterium]